MKVKSYPHDGKIGFYEWNLKAQEKFETLIKDCFKEACKFAKDLSVKLRKLADRLDEAADGDE